MLRFLGAGFIIGLAILGVAYFFGFANFNVDGALTQKGQATLEQGVDAAAEQLEAVRQELR